jgi:NAD(P)-dependent dehydrogenase (short-subunit alcohol dehydrogenase family)
MTARVDPVVGRRVLVTGAGSGIGLATAKLLHACGARVHAVDYRAEVMNDRLASEVEEGGVTTHVLDVTDSDAVETLFDRMAEEAPIEVVVLCAGTNVAARRFGELSREAWRTVLATNLDGAFSCLRASLPQLRATRGHAVVIASVSALWPDWSGAAYQASKAGVLALIRAASYEEHDRGVRFTAVMPGMVRTELMHKRPNPPPEEVLAQMLLPEDVADTIMCALRLPARACLSELTVVPTALQAIGKT